MTSNLSRRDFIIGGALAATGIACAGLSPGRAANQLVQHIDVNKMVPTRIGPWSGSDFSPLPIPKAEDAETLGYDSVLTRYYVSDSALPVMLLVAYGSAQTGETFLHRPEVCYKSAGFNLQSWPDARLRIGGTAIPARVLTATAPGRTEQILYWSRVGSDFPTTSLGQRWSTLRQTLTGSIPDGVLVRISVIDEDRAAAMGFINEFAGALLSSANSELRQILEGVA